MNPRLLTLGVVFIYWYTGLLAQPFNFHFKLLNKDIGLSNDSYNSFKTQDSQGFIWISSPSGFYRYDGTKFNRYYIPSRESDQNIQSAFFEDAQQNLWFSTYTGLHFYERKSNQVESVANFKLKDTVIAKKYHVFFIEKKTGWLWLRAGEGIWRYDIYRQHIEKICSTKGIRFTVLLDSIERPSQILACSMLDENIELISLDYSKSEVEANKKIYVLAGLPNKTKVRNAVIANDSLAWLFSSVGVLEFDIRNGLLVNLYKPPGVKDFNCWDGKYFDDPRYLLVSTEGVGLWCFDVYKKKFIQHWKNRLGAKNQLASNRPHELYQDQDGQWWISHDLVGLEQVSIKDQNFEDPLYEQYNQTVGVNGILEDDFQNIWVMSKRAGLFKFSLTGQLISTFDDFVPSTPFKHISKGDSGRIWGIVDNTIYLHSPSESGAINNWEKVLSSEKELVTVYHGDNNRIIIITTEGVFDLVKDRVEYDLVPNKDFEDYKGYYFQYFFKLGRGKTLIPFESNTVWLSKWQEKQLKVFDTLNIQARTYGFYLSKGEDSLWLATDRGLLLYHDDTWQFILSGNKDLEGGSLLGMAENDSGNFWLPTDQGLINYETKRKQISEFGEKDGISSNLFNPYTTLKASDGRIWIGNDNGLTVFHPDSIRINTIIPKPHIENLWVNHLPFKPSIVISETDTLSLNYLQNTLDFELRAVGFKQAEACKLGYRLMGYDSSWVEIINGGFARFTKIPPGEYELEILAINANGIKGNLKRMTIQINPPFWQTLWFRLSAFLMIILLIGLAIGSYYRQKLKKAKMLLEKQTSLAAERDRIAGELHDDMGGNLSSILTISDDLLDEGNEYFTPSLSRVKELATGALENMKVIVWARDTQKNTLEDLVFRLRKHSIDFVSDNKMNLVLDFPKEDLTQFVIGGERRRNIFLIVKEFLHNIAKHASASEVIFSLSVTNDQLLISIADDGKGFDISESGGMGNGMGSMNKRAIAIGGVLRIESSIGQGSKMMLSLDLEPK